MRAPWAQFCKTRTARTTARTAAIGPRAGRDHPRALFLFFWVARRGRCFCVPLPLFKPFSVELMWTSARGSLVGLILALPFVDLGVAGLLSGEGCDREYVRQAAPPHWFSTARRRDNCPPIVESRGDIAETLTMWKVDSVRSVCVPGAPFGYGFSITTERGKQLVGFAYIQYVGRSPSRRNTSAGSSQECIICISSLAVKSLRVPCLR